MSGKEKMTAEIEVLREVLASLIRNKEDLLDPEILWASKQLDIALNEYNRRMIGQVGR